MIYSDELIQEVWMKGSIVPDNDPEVWRKDECGAWIQRSMHGDRNSQYGWEIDHIASNESDDLANLRPLQWKNSVSKGDGKLRCRVVAEGVDNKELDYLVEPGNKIAHASSSRE